MTRDIPRVRQALHAWLRSGPGTVTGPTIQAAAQRAYAAFCGHSGINVSLDVFAALLYEAGYLPQSRRDPDRVGEFLTVLTLPPSSS